MHVVLGGPEVSGMGGSAGFSIRSPSFSAGWVTSQWLSFLICEMGELLFWVEWMIQFINEVLLMQTICKQALQESDNISVMEKVFGLGPGGSKERRIKWTKWLEVVGG